MTRNQSDNLRVVVVQMNSTVGDIAGNADKIRRHIASAKAAGADIIVFPELALTGFHPGDLLCDPRFLQQQDRALRAIAGDIGGEIVAKGSNARDVPWRISVEVPKMDAGLGRDHYKVLSLDNSAVATSGDYRNYFRRKGRLR